MARCRNCGTDGDEFGLLPITGMDWDAVERGDDDALLGPHVLGHRCAEGTSCAQRIIEQGTNIKALREVARDYENLGELATQARTILNEYAALAHQIARANDAAARERGYGQVGGGLP